MAALTIGDAVAVHLGQPLYDAISPMPSYDPCRSFIAIAQENLVNSGKYEIRFCGKGSGSKVAQLQVLLSQFRDDLELVPLIEPPAI